MPGHLWKDTKEPPHWIANLCSDEAFQEMAFKEASNVCSLKFVRETKCWVKILSFYNNERNMFSPQKKTVIQKYVFLKLLFSIISLGI